MALGPIVEAVVGTRDVAASVAFAAAVFGLAPVEVLVDADPDRLHGELHSAVVNVEDMDAAVRLFVDAGGLVSLFDGMLEGGCALN